MCHIRWKKWTALRRPSQPLPLRRLSGLHPVTCCPTRLVGQRLCCLKARSRGADWACPTGNSLCRSAHRLHHHPAAPLDITGAIFTRHYLTLPSHRPTLLHVCLVGPLWSRTVSPLPICRYNKAFSLKWCHSRFKIISLVCLLKCNLYTS